MKLRTRLLLLIALVFCVLSGLAGRVLYLTAHANLQRHELEALSHESKQLDALVTQQLEALERSTTDWAIWDETFNYIEGRDSGFEARNLSGLSLELVAFDELAILDLEGKPRVHVERGDGVRRLDRAIPEALGSALAPPFEARGRCGLLARQPAPLMYCLHPVGPSQLDKPFNGYLFAARRLNTARMEDLRRAMLQPLMLQHALPPQDVALKPLSGSANETAYTLLPSEQYLLIKRFMARDGTPAFWLSYTYERASVQEAERIFLRMIALMGGALFASLLLLYFLIDALLLRRLKALETAVRHASDNNDWNTPVPGRSGRDEIAGLAREIHALFRAMGRNVSRLKKESLHDALTGLPNRRSFDQALRLFWRNSRRKRASLSVMMIDIDHFKAYNDHYGHPAGDMVLRRVAGTLRAALMRESDFIARYGGEEFAVLVADLTPDQAQALAERLRTAVAAAALPHEKARGGIITLSIGVSTALGRLLPSNAEAVLQRADEALYAAKGAGRNTVASLECPIA